MEGNVGPSGPMGAVGTAGATGMSRMKGDMGEVGPPGPPPAVVGGATYTRWGSSTCRAGVSLVYSGRTGVTRRNNQGGATNHVCMPDNPTYTLLSNGGVQGFNWVSGTEYEVPLVASQAHHDAACSVCYIATQHTTLMIPATTVCPTGWTVEYIGYIMSEARLHWRTEFLCVDASMGSVPGTQSDDGNTGNLYHVEPDCSGLACPPYDAQRELNCVVCSR